MYVIHGAGNNWRRGKLCQEVVCIFFIDIAELRNSTEEAVFRPKENSENMVAS